MMMMMIMVIIIITIIMSWNYRKQPYCALHTYFGKYQCKYTADSTLKLRI